MKKVIVKTTKKPAKKESEIETLARAMHAGFSKIDDKFNHIEKRFDGIDKRFDAVDKRFDEVDKKFDAVDKRFDDIDKKFEVVNTQLSSINNEQRETNRRLDIIERKQVGMLSNLDETVYRSEFKVLIKRVDLLEKKFDRK
ncbi:TPA: hypothetical protein DEP94_00605 [Candidatus Nomurabacteria bacterium]|nr:hypothetical protein [Candidatus Nomurabacteria bacterium]